MRYKVPRTENCKCVRHIISYMNDLKIRKEEYKWELFANTKVGNDTSVYTEAQRKQVKESLVRVSLGQSDLPPRPKIST